MRTTLVLTGLLLAALLAGCTSDDAGTDDVTVPETTFPTLLGHADCNEQIGITPIPWDDAAAMLPEGFTPVPYDAASEGVLATEFVLAYGCAASTGAVEDANATAELTGGLLVNPPEQYLAENVTYYAWTYGFFTTKEQNAQVYNAWNLSHSLVGQVEVGSLAQNDVAGVGHALGSADGFAVHLYSTVHGDVGAEVAGTIRLFGFDHDTMAVTNAVDFSWTESTWMRSGQAVVHVDPLTAFVPPAAPGFAFHIGGEYSYSLAYVALEPVTDAHAAHTGLVGTQFRAQ